MAEFSYLVDLEADSSVTRGRDRVDGELPRGILQSYREDGVDSSVGVFDLHVEVRKRSSIWNVLRNGNLVLCLVEPGWFVIDISDGDGQPSRRTCTGILTWKLWRNLHFHHVNYVVRSAEGPAHTRE